MKILNFVDNSLADLRNFPNTARREAGFQLRNLQKGFEPTNYKPMSSIGVGVKEIRITDKNGAFRIIYIAKFKEIIYVLHCFQKKTQKTAKKDIDIATNRYKNLLKGVKK